MDGVRDICVNPNSCAVLNVFSRMSSSIVVCDYGPLGQYFIDSRSCKPGTYWIGEVVMSVENHRL